MKTIVIGDQELNIKDYYCSCGDGYPDKPDGKLWLYVNLTDMCNGACAFCINPSVKNGVSIIDPERFKETLMRIKDNVYGVSITGGEPMLYPELTNEVIGIVKDVCGNYVEKDMVTNGTGFSNVHKILDLKNLDSVHLSRHRITDADNDKIFGFPTVTANEISKTIAIIDDPAQIVLNCVLMVGGIDTAEELSKYLEFASVLGVRNVSFIGLSRHNAYCEENYIDPRQLDIIHNPRFHIWNEYCDHEYCSCSSGSYDAEKGSIRFYYRRIGEMSAPFARQLVYTADGRLLAGFSGKEIRFNQDK